MSGYIHARCLFCETGKENCVVHTIQENKWGHAIFAQSTRVVRRDRKWGEEISPLFPGYVFVYSSQENSQCADYQSIPHVIRVLTYNNGIDQLAGRDLEFADWLWRLNGRIGVMKAVEIGDRVEVIDGIFKELRGTITRMDRRRRAMRVLLETQGAPKQIWLSYEVVEKQKDGDFDPYEATRK